MIKLKNKTQKHFKVYFKTFYLIKKPFMHKSIRAFKLTKFKRKQIYGYFLTIYYLKIWRLTLKRNSLSESAASNYFRKLIRALMEMLTYHDKSSFSN